MRPTTPTEMCTQIAAEHAANTVAAIHQERAVRLAIELENFGAALTALATELHQEMNSPTEEDTGE